jgi:asparagine synthase (glutamine-hydrolysing)
MCGIIGLINFKTPIERKQIKLMTSSLSHRGPDEEGIWIDGNVALGHRRLAIIDLSTGKQPMSNEDGKIWIAFNGEIYNYKELRQQLIEKGYRFKTNSDTEVIVHSYEEWGDSCVEKFRGMFAFGIVDLYHRRIFLARDHLGIKPLYYIYTPTCFAFSSEIQALRQLPLNLDLDFQAIDQYLWLQYIPPPKTAFQQIKKLKPAHRFSITFDGNLTPTEEYWKINFIPICNRSESDWLDELEFVLKDSVETHLVSDVPFGAFLSGGVDSSAIVAYMSQLLKEPVKTFSIGFEEVEFNELNYAETAAKRWRTEHYTEIVKPEAIEILLPKLVKHYGEPFGDSSAIPTYYVCKIAREHVTMVLSGDGGDESFAGYNTYQSWLKWLYPKDIWKKLFYPIAHAIRPKRYPRRAPVLDNWFKFITQINVHIRENLWRQEYQHIIQSSLDIFEKEFSRTNDYGIVQKVQYLDLKTYMPCSILTKVDIASMMNSLEVRTPFVDVKLVELAGTIPESLNININNQGELEGKLLLKKLMRKYYSAEFLNRPKMGFSIPIQKWFSKQGSLYNLIQERLLSQESKIHNLFDPNSIKTLVKNQATTPLWLLLFLEEWLNQNT